MLQETHSSAANDSAVGEGAVVGGASGDVGGDAGRGRAGRDASSPPPSGGAGGATPAARTATAGRGTSPASAATSTAAGPPGAALAVRIVSIDFYRSRPGPGDAKRSRCTGKPLPRVPVVRIFGHTPLGQNACVNVHGAMPYFYVRMPEELGGVTVATLDAQGRQGLLHALASGLENAMAMHQSAVGGGGGGGARPFGLGKGQHQQQPFEPPVFVYEVRWVEGWRSIYGYRGEGEEFFAQIWATLPQYVSTMAQLLLQGAVLSTSLQPYEVHLPYLLHFLDSFGLGGMRLLHLGAGALVRCGGLPERPLENFPLHPLWREQLGPEVIEELTSDPGLWSARMPRPPGHSVHPRATSCELEIDCCVNDILRASALEGAPPAQRGSPGLTPAPPSICSSPLSVEGRTKGWVCDSLRDLWHDEERRCRTRGVPPPWDAEPPPVPGAEPEECRLSRDVLEECLDRRLLAFAGCAPSRSSSVDGLEGGGGGGESPAGASSAPRSAGRTATPRSARVALFLDSPGATQQARGSSFLDTVGIWSQPDPGAGMSQARTATPRAASAGRAAATATAAALPRRCSSAELLRTPGVSERFADAVERLEAALSQGVPPTAVAGLDDLGDAAAALLTQDYDPRPEDAPTERDASSDEEEAEEEGAEEAAPAETAPAAPKSREEVPAQEREGEEERRERSEAPALGDDGAKQACGSLSNGPSGDGDAAASAVKGMDPATGDEDEIPPTEIPPTAVEFAPTAPCSPTQVEVDRVAIDEHSSVAAAAPDGGLEGDMFAPTYSPLKPNRLFASVSPTQPFPAAQATPKVSPPFKASRAAVAASAASGPSSPAAAITVLSPDGREAAAAAAGNARRTDSVGRHRHGSDADGGTTGAGPIDLDSPVAVAAAAAARRLTEDTAKALVAKADDLAAAELAGAETAKLPEWRPFYSEPSDQARMAKQPQGCCSSSSSSSRQEGAATWHYWKPPPAVASVRRVAGASDEEDADAEVMTRFDNAGRLVAVRRHAALAAPAAVGAADAVGAAVAGGGDGGAGGAGGAGGGDCSSSGVGGVGGVGRSGDARGDEGDGGRPPRAARRLSFTQMSNATQPPAAAGVGAPKAPSAASAAKGGAKARREGPPVLFGTLLSLEVLAAPAPAQAPSASSSVAPPAPMSRAAAAAAAWTSAAGPGPATGAAAPPAAASEVLAIAWTLRDERVRRAFPAAAPGAGEYEDMHGVICVGPLVQGLGARVHVESVASEARLLEAAAALLRRADPAVVVGYDVCRGSLGLLLDRARALGAVDTIRHFGRAAAAEGAGGAGAPQEPGGGPGGLAAGEAREEILTQGPDGGAGGAGSAASAAPRRLFPPELVSGGQDLPGRLVLNVWRVLRGEAKLQTSSMQTAARELLGETLPLVPPDVASLRFRAGGPRGRAQALRHLLRCCGCNLRFLDALNVLPRAAEAARMLGIDVFSVLSRGSQYRVEGMLMRAAHRERKLLLSPSKVQVAGQRGAECIPMVMEPRSGFYFDPVLVLDFQSLYPSIVIAYNLCYSTCLGKLQDGGEEASKLGVLEGFARPRTGLDPRHLAALPNETVFLRRRMRRGVLPQMLFEILQTRIMAKRALKELRKSGGGGAEVEAQARILDARQFGLKMIANVTYGYTGASFSGRMPCVELADAIVQTARRTLERAVRWVEREISGAEVVYGDTDSLFVRLPGRSKAEAFEVGARIAKEVTRRNPRPVELQLEKVYLPCCLVSKKRYVGHAWSSPSDTAPVFDAKGIETIRRDQCAATQHLMRGSLEVLFTSGGDLSKVKEYLQGHASRFRSGRLSIKDFIFHHELRPQEDYRSGGPLAAQAVRRSGAPWPSPGERFAFVVAQGPPGSRLADVAVVPRDIVGGAPFRPSGGGGDLLFLDVEYYLGRQIGPAIQRLFGLLRGPDGAPGFANIQRWLADGPRPLRRDVAAASAAAADAGAGLGRRGGAGAGGFAGGGSSLLLSSLAAGAGRARRCRLCSQPAAAATAASAAAAGAEQAPLCSSCRSHDGMPRILELAARQRHWEARLQRCAELCLHCAGSTEAASECRNIYCGVFFRKANAQLRLSGLGGSRSWHELLQDW